MGSLVSPTLRDRVRGAAEPIARGLGRLGLTPNALTLVGFAIAIVAAYASASHAWLAAGLLVAFGAGFDLLDGTLARATNTASRFGAFMDSTFDRAGEVVVYIGIALAYLGSDVEAMALLPMAAMAAALMVSYTRAKAESLGFASGKGLASVGFAPREVRVVILAVGLVLTDLGGGLGRFMWPTAGSQFLFLALALITLLATVTTIQRIVHVYLQSKKESQS